MIKSDNLAVLLVVVMTDDEIPCTVFRMDTLDWNSSVKYIKARSVIVKDAWTKKNLFIVSLNQHIRYICQASYFVNIGLGLQTQIWQLNCGKRGNSSHLLGHLGQ